MNVATALTDPRVRGGQLYFRAKDPGAHNPNQTALFRIHSDPAQSVLGGHTWVTLQKLVTDVHGSPPFWYAVGNNADIDWLPVEAELIEPTKELVFAPKEKR